jgi:ABC-type polysaccharide/polyol phosphate transport system ATPase subunit
LASIRFENVTFSYPLVHRNLRSRDGSSKGEVNVFSNLTLEVSDGVRLAVVGANGAGKTTLLKLVAGILKPTTGCIRIDGEVLPLLNVRLGMESELTGIENILLRGAYMGRTRAEIEERLPQIVDFADLGEFIELPINIYSGGMIARLAFAIATSFEPEILVMDESIGAGDKQFAAKAAERLRQFVDTSNILVLASHNERLIKQMCNTVLDVSTGKTTAL